MSWLWKDGPEWGILTSKVKGLYLYQIAFVAMGPKMWSAGLLPRVSVYQYGILEEGPWCQIIFLSGKLVVASEQLFRFLGRYW